MASAIAAFKGFPHPAPGVTQAPRLQVAARDWRTLESADLDGWDLLAQDAAEPNPFYESWYALPSLRLFDPHRKVALLTLEADGRLVGLLPVRREHDYYGHALPHWRNWLHANMFLGSPLVAAGYEAAFWREVLDWCDRNAGSALFLHLAQLPEEGPLQRGLARVLDDTHRRSNTVIREERALLHSKLSARDYLEHSLCGKKRKELRRQQRRLAEAGDLSVERTDGTEDIDRWTAEFLAIESAGWKGAAGSALGSTPATRKLFEEAVAGAASRGRLERLAVRLDGKPIAMLASFLCPPGAFSYKTAFDEAFARYSPGVLLQCENLALVERDGIAWVDSCAAANHPMIDHLWRERRSIVSCNLALGGPMRRLLFRALAARESGAGKDIA